LPLHAPSVNNRTDFAGTLESFPILFCPLSVVSGQKPAVHGC
jgi:hypothetical protein